jgi:hypothetical protein
MKTQKERAMWNNVYIALVVIFTVNLVSCKDDDNNDESATPVVVSPYDNAAEIELLPGSAVLSAAANALGSANGLLLPSSAVLSAAANALGSANGLLNSAGASLKLQSNLTADSSQSTNDLLCSNHAEPWDSTTDAVMLDSNSEFTARLFYCAFFGNVIESSGSVAGVLAQNQAITCTIESHFSLDASSYTTTVQELVTGDSEDVALTAACWPNGIPDGLTSIPFSSVEIEAMDADTTGWTHSIRIKSTAAEIDMELKTFTGNGTFGFARSENSVNAPGAGDDIRMTVDMVNGVLMFNSINDRAGGGGADSAYRTLIRAKVSGTIDATDFSFSAVNSTRGFYGISGPDFNAANDTDYAWNMYTVDGNPTTGFQWKRFIHETGESVTELSSTCTEGTTTCADAESIGTNEEMYALMSRTSVVEGEWSALITSGMPLCEPAADSEVNFSGAPTFTGKLGQCIDTSAPAQYTCTQTHEGDSFTKNCSTLFTANSLQEAADECLAEEADGGQGCCSSSSVFINAFGPVESYEVVPLGAGRGNGTSYTCE